VNYALLDNKPDVPRDLDVIKRIAPDHHKIAKLSRLNRAKPIINTKCGSTVYSGRFLIFGVRVKTIIAGHQQSIFGVTH
jgi:hypothetical protein